MKNLKSKLTIAIIIILIASVTSVVYSHCQIPCGIYDDPARLNAIAEHITTIEKSMKQITQLSKEKPENMNKIVRWVQNKEDHAAKLSEIVTYYFMTQRIKPVGDRESKEYQQYTQKLTLLHKMLFYNMKAKQSTDLSHVEKLRSLLAEFKTVYLGQAS